MKTNSFNSLSIDQIKSSKTPGVSMSRLNEDGSYTQVDSPQDATAIHIHRNSAPAKAFSTLVEAAGKKLGTKFTLIKNDKKHAMYVLNRSGIKTGNEFLASLEEAPF